MKGFYRIGAFLIPLLAFIALVWFFIKNKLIKQTNDVGEISFGLDELKKSISNSSRTVNDSIVNLIYGLDYQKKESESVKQKLYSDIEERLNTLEYIPIQINSFSSSVNNVEKGAVVNNVNFSFSFNKTPTSASINNGIGAVTGSSKSATVNITQDTTFVLTASDGQTTKTSSTNIRFLSKVYWGTSPQPTLNNEGILALSNSRLSSNRVNDITVNGNGEYIYYASPVELGDVIFNVNGFVSSLIRFEINHTNAQEFSSSYYLYRTNNVQFGSGINIKTS